MANTNQSQAVVLSKRHDAFKTCKGCKHGKDRKDQRLSKDVHCKIQCKFAENHPVKITSRPPAPLESCSTRPPPASCRHHPGQA